MTRTCLAIALCAALLAPDAASAQLYRDLPGVVDPAQAEPGRRVTCEQVILRNADPFLPTNGPRYSTVYECTQDGLTFQGNRLPPSLERQKRGLNW
ncbi:hypothetical protein [Ensifer soli]|uniref:hypothetical protein n=1 Tax=Ciceribacter sp. sgz301302 TaxID=3342379 RepID=UPI0035BA7C49